MEENMTNYEKAEIDYISGTTYKKIAEKYEVAESTVKSWKRRYGWERKNIPKKGCKDNGMQGLGNNFDLIKNDLLNQLESNGVYGEHYIDLIKTYMELFNIKNNLILDIKDRGVSVEWFNGKQIGIKKNESIAELNKTISQMLSIISDLGLKPVANNGNNGGKHEEL